MINIILNGIPTTVDYIVGGMPFDHEYYRYADFYEKYSGPTEFEFHYGQNILEVKNAYFKWYKNTLRIKGEVIGEI